ncbi:MAG: hypothetical protein JSS08_01260 [Proteobacteria bacterium]|nr:hypothetical protein [Pseudomonadota bacterium]
MNMIQALKQIEAGERAEFSVMDAFMLNALGEIAGNTWALVALIEAAEEAQAVLTNVLAHYVDTMPPADRTSREALAQRLQSLLKTLNA